MGLTADCEVVSERKHKHEAAYLAWQEAKTREKQIEVTVRNSVAAEANDTVNAMRVYVASEGPTPFGGCQTPHAQCGVDGGPTGSRWSVL